VQILRVRSFTATSDFDIRVGANIIVIQINCLQTFLIDILNFNLKIFINEPTYPNTVYVIILIKIYEILFSDLIKCPKH